MDLPSTGGTISFSDISCLAPPPAPTCQHNAQEIDIGITYHDIIDGQWYAIQCFATPSCRRWSYDGGAVGIDPEYRFCHLFTQNVAQLSPPVSSTKALNNFQYWDMSCHCGAMTSRHQRTTHYFTQPLSLLPLNRQGRLAKFYVQLLFTTNPIVIIV